jgi:hypothetical protein
MRLGFLRIVRISCFATLFLLPLGCDAQTPTRITLVDAAVLHDSVVRVSDLLPADAPIAVQLASREITLGESPLPGTHRLISRIEIQRVLRKFPPLRTLLYAPETIDVERLSRLLDAQDVLTALNESFRARGIASTSPVTAGDLVIPSSLEIANADPKLKVTRIEPASDGSGTHIRLALVSEPRTPPFWVKLRQTIDGPELDSGDSRVASVAAPHHRFVKAAFRNANFRPTDPLPAPLADRSADRSPDPGSAPEKSREVSLLRLNPASLGEGIENPSGKPMELTLKIRDMKIKMLAIPLESGRPGEKIRLRNPRSGKIFTGTVVSQGTVEVDY